MTDDRKSNLDKMVIIAKSKTCNAYKTKLRFASNSKVLSDRKALEGQRALKESFI
ncbi:hypothetical protein PV797_00760 [Clostridiaceae bacterium M8S5]|nr:hypothetical protein PV797_00760 [Clostridiaceae bacterium M8S5]